MNRLSCNKPFRAVALLVGFAVLISATPESVEAQTGARNFVQLEIISADRSAIQENQRWVETLGDIGADSVRLRTSAGSVKAAVQKTKTRTGTSYKITGMIDGRNRLILPGGTYTIRDTAGIKAYIESIRADGAEVALAEKVAFGLTARQLVLIHEQLKPVIEESTIGLKPSDILLKVKANTATPFVIDPSATEALRDTYVLEDEFKGMSGGTALAAALRPLGLVFAPQREQGKQPVIVITDMRRVDEHWPVGWPLKVRPSESVPKLMERIPVNIRNYTMKDTLTVIQKSIKKPFLFDRNSMELKSVDLAEIRVTVQSKKLSYQLILNRIVSQARPGMQMELRADEAGNGFFWFSAR